MRFSIIIPTYNGGDVWAACAKSISEQIIKPDFVYVIDSSSVDNSVSIANFYGFSVKIISQNSFNHGGTRNYAALEFFNSDVLIFMTQDAILSSEFSIKTIINCFSCDEKIAAVCGRQIPHDDANPLAVHARLFNYPDKNDIRDEQSIYSLGIKAAFMSNSFAAYRTKIFFELGGFPSNTILSEDMYLAAKMILAGYKVAYCADASVKHSHNYTPWNEFRRYFDIGVFHACEPWIREKFGSVTGEGKRFIRSELMFLWKTAPVWIPQALISTVCKFLGYKLGQKYRKLSWSWCRRLSMYQSYWLQNKK